MEYYVYTEGDKKDIAYRRCFEDAENGRVWLSLMRLDDLRKQFRDDADIDYAEALIRLTYLGEGNKAQELCWHAYQRNKSLKEALFNSVRYSPDQITFNQRISEVNHMYPYEAGIQKLNQSNLYYKDRNEPFWKFMVSLLNPEFAEDQPGKYAATIQLILNEGCDSIPPAEYAKMLRLRGESLRKLDRKAEDRLRFQGEHFLPEDRLALKQAFYEFENYIDDPYFRNQETVNLCCVYAMLLGLYDKAIKYADEAIELGGQDYINPFRNKSLTFWEMGRKQESIALDEKIIKKALQSGDKIQAEEINRTLEIHKKNTPLNLTEFRPNLEMVLKGAGDLAYSEITAGKSTLEGIANSFRQRLNMVGMKWTVAYIPVIAEMFAFFSPEASLFILQEAINKMPAQYRQNINNNIITTTQYLACYCDGTLNHDATRLLSLFILSLLDAKSILNEYRHNIRNISLAAGDSPISNLSGLIKNEISRISPDLPVWLEDQSKITAEEMNSSVNYVNERILPIPKELNSKNWWKQSDKSLPKKGCAPILLLGTLGMLLFWGTFIVCFTL